jgi:two-component system response regulator MprA
MSDARRARVLVVEDDAEIAAGLDELLGLSGYDVTIARDGADGLARLRAEPPPDVVLLDLMMPRMDGYSFREAQLADPRLAAIPTLVLTADRTAQAHAARLAAPLLSKPFAVADLLSALESLLRPGPAEPGENE